jgi:hypothetical protein
LLFLDSGWVRIRIRDKNPGYATLDFFMGAFGLWIRIRILIQGGPRMVPIENIKILYFGLFSFESVTLTKN